MPPSTVLIIACSRCPNDTNGIYCHTEDPSVIYCHADEPSDTYCHADDPLEWVHTGVVAVAKVASSDKHVAIR